MSGNKNKKRAGDVAEVTVSADFERYARIGRSAEDEDVVALNDAVFCNICEVYCVEEHFHVDDEQQQQQQEEEVLRTSSHAMPAIHTRRGPAKVDLMEMSMGYKLLMKSGWNPAIDKEKLGQLISVPVRKNPSVGLGCNAVDVAAPNTARLSSVLKEDEKKKKKQQSASEKRSIKEKQAQEKARVARIREDIFRDF